MVVTVVMMLVMLKLKGRAKMQMLSIMKTESKTDSALDLKSNTIDAGS